MKFTDHNLPVESNSIKRLFKTAALNRSRDEPCRDLTLYEFCLFSKSEKAAAGFQELMQGIKEEVRHTKLARRVSSIGLPIPKTGPSKIMPSRGSKYVSFLPSAFNPLMNHFKDEETRNEIRNKVVNGLKLIDVLSEKSDVNTIIKENTELLKNLIASHFPKEDIDDEYRKLLIQSKRGFEVHKRMQEHMDESLRSNRKRSSVRNSIFLSSGLTSFRKAIADSPASYNKHDNFSLGAVAGEKAAELEQIVESARKGTHLSLIATRGQEGGKTHDQTDGQYSEPETAGAHVHGRRHGQTAVLSYE